MFTIAPGRDNLKILVHSSVVQLFSIMYTLALQTISSPRDCPTQCICVTNRMNCEVPGLKNFPPPYMLQLEFLLVQNQAFANSHLGPTELSMYVSPEYGGKVRLKSLQIRFCNIRTIGRNAFQALGSNLEMIDLTGNPLKHIGDYAFSGLGQIILILDEIEHPSFGDHAFTGLVRIKSLMMRYAKLETLPYKPLLHLTSERKLDRLLLKGNRLQHLDKKFDRVFRVLQDFEISANPWHCGCELTWLIEVYNSMLRGRASAREKRQKRSPDGSAMNWDAEDNHPKCGSPSVLHGRNFSDLITDMNEVYTYYANMRFPYNPPTVIYCPPPQLQRMDIDLRDFIQQPLLETYTISESEAHKKSNIHLKCAVRGSSRLALKWRYHHPTMGISDIRNMNITTPHSMADQRIRPWTFNMDDTVELESDINIERNRDLDVYSCLGQDTIGNVSALVRIKWPPLKAVKPPVKQPIAPSIVRNVSTKPNPNDWSADILSFHYTLLHTPQFSLGQLLGAIAGTFLLTVSLFIVVYRVLHCRLAACRKQKRSESAKSETRIIKSSRPSPTATSSSITSSPNTDLFAPLIEQPMNSIPIQLNPDSIPLTANILNAHLMNCAPVLGHCTLPLGVSPTDNQTVPMLGLVPATQPATLFKNISTSSLAAYEPVAYTDANNLTYDVPWMININTTTTSPLRTQTEHQNASLMNGLSLGVNRSGDILNNLPNSVHIQPSLAIPPPPSFPQPSLPASGHSSNLPPSANHDVLPTAYSFASQAGFPVLNCAPLYNSVNTTH